MKEYKVDSTYGDQTYLENWLNTQAEEGWGVVSVMIDPFCRNQNLTRWVVVFERES